MKKILIFAFILLNLTGCTNTDVRDNSLVIAKIGIDEKYSIVNLDDDVNGIVMYSECGRPDKDGSNTVIGAHSGIGSNALFNNISKLEIGDLISLVYNNYEYTYAVIDVKVVNDSDSYILDDTGENLLTLITCKFGYVDKRIVVISKLTIDL
ncbi:MAG: sortase [Bacilli bacterium]|nr:sortase [Bacilli bacterium]MBQ6282517.1 sortase [Bacilli bacterium]